MKRVFTIFLLIIVINWIRLSKPHAFQTPETEYSDPYLSLTVDKDEVGEGQEINFSITFGNRGPEPAKNVKITLNQPLDGRAPLEFISSEPDPDRWFNSEFGNLAEFIIEEVETYEATEEGKIKLTARVRDSIAPQILTPTANLQAPNRERGKRLVVSYSATIKIGKTTGASDINDIQGGSTSSSPSSKLVEEKNLSKDTPLPTPGITKPLNNNLILDAQAPWSTIVFLAISFLLILAFFAGRKSRKIPHSLKK